MNMNEYLLSEKEQLIRMAMCVDTDGHIGITKEEAKYIKYSQYIIIVNTNIKLIEWCVGNFGGKIPKPQNRGENNKDSYLWKLYGYNSYKLIKKIRTFLLLKQEQADIVIELWEKVSKWKYGGFNSMPKYNRELAESLYKRCRELNKRGKSNEESRLPKLVRKKTKVTETLEDYM